MLNLQVKHEPARNRYVLVAPEHDASIQVFFPHEEVKKLHPSETVVPSQRPMHNIEYSAIKVPGADYPLTDKGTIDLPDSLAAVVERLFTEADRLSNFLALVNQNHPGQQHLEEEFSYACSIAIGLKVQEWIRYQLHA